VRTLLVFLVGSRVMVSYLLYWTPLQEVVFGLVGQPVRETAAQISLGGYAHGQCMSRR